MVFFIIILLKLHYPLLTSPINHCFIKNILCEFIVDIINQCFFNFAKPSAGIIVSKAGKTGFKILFGILFICETDVYGNL